MGFNGQVVLLLSSIFAMIGKRSYFIIDVEKKGEVSARANF